VANPKTKTKAAAIALSKPKAMKASLASRTRKGLRLLSKGLSSPKRRRRAPRPTKDKEVASSSRPIRAKETPSLRPLSRLSKPDRLRTAAGAQ